MSQKLEDEFIYYNYLLQQYPANKARWSKTTLLTLEQAFFLSYGIEPYDENKNPELLIEFDRIVHQVDIFSIFELSRNAVLAGILEMQNRCYVKAENFVNWAEGYDLPIKKEFFCIPLSEDVAKHNDVKKRQSTAQTKRKEIIRSIATAHWDLLHKQGQKFTNPAELARNKQLIILVKALNELIGTKPVKGDVFG